MAESCGLIRSSGRLTGACSRLFPSYATRCRYDVAGVLASSSGLAALLAEGALESPSILVLSFHSSLFLVGGSSDGSATGDRFLSPGRMCLITPFRLRSVASALSLSESWLFLFLWICRCVTVGSSGAVSQTFEVPMRVGSSSSLHGLSSDWVFSPGVCRGSLSRVLTSPVWSLLAPRSWEPASWSTPFSRSVTFWRLCGASWSPPTPTPHPCSLAHCGAPWLVAFRPGHCCITAGLASMDGPLLVSSDESQLSECPFMVLPRQLIGSGVFPCFAHLPYFSVMKRSSFGLSASVSRQFS